MLLLELDAGRWPIRYLDPSGRVRVQNFVAITRILAHQRFAGILGATWFVLVLLLLIIGIEGILIPEPGDGELLLLIWIRIIIWIFDPLERYGQLCACTIGNGGTVAAAAATSPLWTLTIV